MSNTGRYRSLTTRRYPYLFLPLNVPQRTNRLRPRRQEHTQRREYLEQNKGAEADPAFSYFS